jgi:hypothetical protein
MDSNEPCYGILTRCAGCEASLISCFDISQNGWDTRLIYGVPYTFCSRCLRMIKSRPGRDHPDQISTTLQSALTKRHGIIFKD